MLTKIYVAICDPLGKMGFKYWAQSKAVDVIHVLEQSSVGHAAHSQAWNRGML